MEYTVNLSYTVDIAAKDEDDAFLKVITLLQLELGGYDDEVGKALEEYLRAAGISWDVYEAGTR